MKSHFITALLLATSLTSVVAQSSISVEPLIGPDRNDGCGRILWLGNTDQQKKLQEKHIELPQVFSVPEKGSPSETLPPKAIARINGKLHEFFRIRRNESYKDPLSNSKGDKFYEVWQSNNDPDVKIKLECVVTFVFGSELRFNGKMNVYTGKAKTTLIVCGYSGC